MRFRVSSRGKIAVGGFKLTGNEIDLEVSTDLTKYRTIYRERYGREPAVPLDVENFVKERWDVEVLYEDILQPADEEILGYFAPEVRTIVVDPRICNHPRRLSFTVAHEAGHLSLHAFMFPTNGDKSAARITRQKIKTNHSIEWQANIYAAHLLAPKFEVMDLLEELGLATRNVIPRAIDIEQVINPFQERFGLSRQAMELYFRRLGVPVLNARYRAD